MERRARVVIYLMKFYEIFHPSTDFKCFSSYAHRMSYPNKKHGIFLYLVRISISSWNFPKILLVTLYSHPFVDFLESLNKVLILKS